MYSAFMTVGHGLMNKGRLMEAGWAFEEASWETKSADEKASALQMQGITQRLLGELDASLETLKLARATADSVVLKARITRDLGMTYVNQGKYVLANDELRDSYAILVRNHEPVEAAMSKGFQGRAKLLEGSRKEAIRLMRETNKVLAGGNNRNYELNNLIWLMRASHLVRFTGLPRAIRLVKQTGQLRRWKELAVIVIGGNWLYRILRKHG